jgi:hypothetical protein
VTKFPKVEPLLIFSISLAKRKKRIHFNPIPTGLPASERVDRRLCRRGGRIHGSTSRAQRRTDGCSLCRARFPLFCARAHGSDRGQAQSGPGALPRRQNRHDSRGRVPVRETPLRGQLLQRAGDRQSSDGDYDEHDDVCGRDGTGGADMRMQGGSGAGAVLGGGRESLSERGGVRGPEVPVSGGQ